MTGLVVRAGPLRRRRPLLLLPEHDLSRHHGTGQLLPRSCLRPRRRGPPGSLRGLAKELLLQEMLLQGLPGVDRLHQRAPRLPLLCHSRQGLWQQPRLGAIPRLRRTLLRAPPSRRLLSTPRLAPPIAPPSSVLPVPVTCSNNVVGGLRLVFEDIAGTVFATLLDATPPQADALHISGFGRNQGLRLHRRRCRHVSTCHLLQQRPALQLRRDPAVGGPAPG
mmetsp:Transcript_3521/g.10695  ORF Transcript_3521/g.10695 Transcript_3521/m.10695 type:complete len:221 (+) Transcript_3521:1343-2005(+)